MNESSLIINKIKIKSKKKLSGIIFAKAFCSINIIIYHYLCYSNGKFNFLFKTTNNSHLGFIFVTTFFCISVILLYYNYPKIKSSKIFYFKRWKTIFPSFYVGFFYYYLKKCL